MTAKEKELIKNLGLDKTMEILVPIRISNIDVESIETDLINGNIEEMTVSYDANNLSEQANVIGNAISKVIMKKLPAGYQLERQTYYATSMRLPCTFICKKIGDK